MRSALLLSLVTAALFGLISLTRQIDGPVGQEGDLAAADDEPYLFVG